MRVLILDASAEETQVLASIVNQAFPNVDIVEPTSQVDLPAPSAADPDAVSADRPSPFENDLQAAALFPRENPNPVLRIDGNGVVLYANRAGERLFRSRGVSIDGPLPERWRQAVQETLHEAKERQVQIQINDQVFELDVVPIPAAGYVNVYGRDVTKRIAAERLSTALSSIYRAISTKLDLDEIVQTLLIESVDALGSDTGGFGLREGDAWVLRYGVGLPESAFGVAMTDAEAPVSVLLASERKPVAIVDAEQETELNHSLMARYGVHAVLALPLIVQDTVIGILSFNYHRPRLDFSEAEMDFAQKLAVSASLALENARLRRIESQQRRLAEQRAAELEATLDALASGVAIYDVAGRMVRQNLAAARILGCGDTGLGRSMGEQAVQLRAVMAETGSTRVEEMPASRALRGETVTPELMYLTPLDDPAAETLCAFVGAAPIRDADGNPMGAVASLTDVTELRQATAKVKEQAEELQLANDQLHGYALALESRVQERTAELVEAREQLRGWSRRLLETLESERLAVARELHDEAGQALTTLKIGLGMCQREPGCSDPVAARLEELKQITDSVLENLRSISVRLRPGSLDRAGLVPATRQYIETFQHQTGLNVQFVPIGVEEQRFPPEVETNLYRLVQEALTNVARHAQATHVGVVLQRANGRVTLIIEDDGQGFDLNEALQRGRLGLVGMRERAEMSGGMLTIETKPGSGTSMFVEVPCDC